jgi:hypothetical protein
MKRFLCLMAMMGVLTLSAQRLRVGELGFKFNNLNTYIMMKKKLCQKCKFSSKKLASSKLFSYFCR